MSDDARLGRTPRCRSRGPASVQPLFDVLLAVRPIVPTLCPLRLAAATTTAATNRQDRPAPVHPGSDSVPGLLRSSSLKRALPSRDRPVGPAALNFPGMPRRRKTRSFAGPRRCSLAVQPTGPGRVYNRGQVLGKSQGTRKEPMSDLTPVVFRPTGLLDRQTLGTQGVRASVSPSERG